MDIGWHLVELERQEAVERAMATFRKRNAVREQRRTSLGRGSRRISRQEALNRIAATHPRSALKLFNSYGLGGRRPIPETRGGQ